MSSPVLLDRRLNPDAQILQVPFYQLKRVTRERRALTEALASVAEQLKDVRLLTDPVAIQQTLNALKSKLENLRRKEAQVAASEKEAIDLCLRRCKYIMDIGEPKKGAVIPWQGKKLPRLVADYMFRRGYFESARTYVEKLHLEDLVDMPMYASIQDVAVYVQRKDLLNALVFCKQQTASLVKIKSKFEFYLLIQEIIDLSKTHCMSSVLAAKSTLKPYLDLHYIEVRKILASLILVKQGDEDKLDLYGEGMWPKIKKCLYNDLYNAHHVAKTSQLETELLLGLIAMKAETRKRLAGGDPFIDKNVKLLGENVPTAKHTQCQLLCPVSKAFIDENNPARVLPNGQLCCKKAIEMYKDNKGAFIHPKTGEKIELNKIRNAFVL